MNLLATLGARPWLLGYVILLVLSNAVRLLFPVDGVPSPGQEQIVVAAIGDDVREPIRIAYRYFGNSGEPGGPVVMLIHGTPVAGRAMQPFARKLNEYRTLVPDLPGFGGSTLDIPDYSFASHAHYLLELLDRLGHDAVHVVAYSQGGGVALSLAEAAPGRVRSITLVSAIGVQELELLGDYHLNRGLYAAQLWLLRALSWLTPHFGFLDDAMLNVAYARNFYDSDQRPLRDILARLEVPTLILHGRDDRLVPLAAAVEHHRIVPQSELVLFDGGHMLAFMAPEAMAGATGEFLARVENGTAKTRAGARADRRLQAGLPFDWRQVPAFGGITLALVLLMLAFATYVSEDLACITAGLMVARGMLEFFPATMACMAGIYTGDLLLFLVGKKIGPRALNRAPLRWFVDAHKLERSKAWFERRGPAVIFLSRFLPGTRLPTYLAAGFLQMSILRFSFYFLLAASVWTPLLVAAAYLAGSSVLGFLEAYQQYSLWIAAGLALTLWCVVKFAVPMFSWRGRRLLLSSWRRKTRWEFWPRWVFYPPLFFYVVYLGIRYRSLTLFTASNPAMPASGFVGESKSAILDGLEGAGKRIARYAVVESGTRERRRAAVEEFMRNNALDYPIVLKPDVGERGKGVLIAPDAPAIDDYLRDTGERLIAQEFAPGQEFGIFYYRIPGQDRGRIFAVTDKRPPEVTGDGRRTLEELILSDDRAVCMADTFLDRHAEHLFDVIPDGQRVALVDVGTHCMGCLFLDGARIVTPALESEIDRISKTYDGFYFGRYDIRTPNVDDFCRGENYKVVELNGVTSEATSIYDPANSLFEAYSVLLAQWRLAFRIGAANRERGIRPVPIGELLRSLSDARQVEST